MSVQDERGHSASRATHRFHVVGWYGDREPVLLPTGETASNGDLMIRREAEKFLSEQYGDRKVEVEWSTSVEVSGMPPATTTSVPA